jgi:undecaprenyl-diphosphatase
MDWLIIFGASYLYLIVAALAVYVWWTLPRALRWRVALQAVLGLAFAALLVKLAGDIHPTVRPFVAEHFTPLVWQRGDNGFPSDHTTFTMLAAFVVLPFARKWGLALAGLALLVGLSRVAAGVHQLQDIVGGIVVAGISAFAAFYVAKWIYSTWQAKQSK